MEQLEDTQESLNSDVEGTLTYWRDNYAWFVDLVQLQPNEEALTYFSTNPEYKSKVAYHYVLVYQKLRKTT